MIKLIIESTTSLADLLIEQKIKNIIECKNYKIHKDESKMLTDGKENDKTK